MKRFLCILIMLLLLSGCSKNTPNTTAPQTTAPLTTAPVTTAPETTVVDTQPTEPDLSWIEEVGQPWDAEGALVELPVTVPNGLIYGFRMFFDGDLLLWSQDDHLVDSPRTQICVVELDTGEVLAQADISVRLTALPQPVGDSLYLFDSTSGLIVKLDKQLNELARWQTDIREANVYMDANGTAYVQSWTEDSYALNLETGEQRPILEEDPDISYVYVQNGYLRVEYYHPDNGEMFAAYIDLRTGQRQDMSLSGVSGCEYRNGTWLTFTYWDAVEYTLIPAEGESLRANLGNYNLRLLEDGLLLMVNEHGTKLSIHDLTGKSLAACAISDRDNRYYSCELIPSETMGGYFVMLNNDAAMRLLHWDPSKSQPSEDVPFATVPEPTQMQAQVESRVEELEQEYGLNILVGQETDVIFYDFEVEQVTDWADILDALNTLEDALQDYPEDFFRQLRYGDVQRTEIHLVGELISITEEYSDTYVAFVQEDYDSHVMVVDIYMADQGAYYHEFSHIIDTFLEWDAMQRTDALFSEEGWCNLNPSWFSGYSYTYSWEQEVLDYTCFIDSYSTISPTEDRARVLEYAMVQYDYDYFEEGTVLAQKLAYYCQCIRDAFDTTGWPDTVLWEQYLP